MQRETQNIFYQKFQSLNNDELIIIAKNNIKYILEARFAAITILKERNVKSQHIQDVENDFFNLQKQNINLHIAKNIEDEKILNYLKTNLNKSLIELPLDNYRCLQIRKISNVYFQIRIEHSRSIFSPVVILKIENTKKIKYYPFFYTLPFLLFIVMLIFALGYFYYSENNIPTELIFGLGIFLLFNITLQLLLMPFMYKIIIEKFKNKILNESHVS